MTTSGLSDVGDGVGAGGATEGVPVIVDEDAWGAWMLGGVAIGGRAID